MKRNNTIDQIKGVAAILVVYGHILINDTLARNVIATENKMANCIYSFHNALFMMLSGYVLCYSIQKMHFKGLIKRCISLVIPALFFGTIDYIPYLVEEGFSFSRIVYVYINVGRWFCYAVSLFTIIMYLLYNVCKNIKVQLIFAILIFITLVIGYIYVPILRTAVKMYPFFVVGFYYNMFNTNKIVLKIKEVLMPISIIIFPYILLWNKPVARFIYWIAGFTGIIFVVFIVKNLKISKRIQDGLALLGRLSLQLYCVHPVIIRFMYEPLYNTFAKRLLLRGGAVEKKSYILS